MSAGPSRVAGSNQAGWVRLAPRMVRVQRGAPSKRGAHLGGHDGGQQHDPGGSDGRADRHSGGGGGPRREPVDRPWLLTANILPLAALMARRPLGRLARPAAGIPRHTIMFLLDRRRGRSAGRRAAVRASPRGPGTGTRDPGRRIRVLRGARTGSRRGAHEHRLAPRLPDQRGARGDHDRHDAQLTPTTSGRPARPHRLGGHGHVRPGHRRARVRPEPGPGGGLERPGHADTTRRVRGPPRRVSWPSSSGWRTRCSSFSCSAC